MNVREMLDERNRLVDHYWASKADGDVARKTLSMIDEIDNHIARTDSSHIESRDHSLKIV